MSHDKVHSSHKVSHSHASSPTTHSAPSAALDRLNRADHQEEHTSPKSTPKKTSLTAATYNVAGGNKDHHKKFKDNTSDVVGQKLASGEVGVMALQEVAVNTRNKDGTTDNTGTDYNVEILSDTFAAKYCLNPDVVQQHYQDADGTSHPIREGNAEDLEAAKASGTIYVEGGGHSMEISTESLDENGHTASANGVPAAGENERLDSGDHPVTVYTAHMEDGETYTAVYGASHAYNRSDGGGIAQYGNTVLLGPDQQLKRDAQGKIVPGSIQTRALGTDPTDGERRTAVGVTFQTASGQEATAVSAHLTADDDKEAAVREREDQQKELFDFSQSMSGGKNAIVLGDFNSSKLISHEGFEEARHPDTPDGDHNALPIDHILVSNDVRVKDNTRWVDLDDEEYSDHEMLISEVTL